MGKEQPCGSLEGERRRHEHPITRARTRRAPSRTAHLPELLAAKLLLFTPQAFLQSWQLSNTVCLFRDGRREGEDLLQQDLEQGLEEHGSEDVEEGHVACRAERKESNVGCAVAL